jgi:hypothetical protein
MPIPVAAAIAAGATLLGTGANVYASGKMNKKTREWNDKQYTRTRADSLNDYAMQNEYNSPTAQMSRFRDAGLNPNLIYGQTNEGATVRSSETPAWNPRAPNIDLDAGPTISAFYDTRLKEAQTDNLREAVTTQQADQILKGAQTAATLNAAAKSQFELDQAQSLSSIVIEAAKANLGKTQAETQQLLDNNERQAALTASSLREATERILRIRIENLKTKAETENTKVEKQRLLKAIDNLDSDNQLKKEDLELRKLGINPSDPAWQRNKSPGKESSETRAKCGLLTFI